MSEATKEFQKKVERNEWETNFDETIATIKQLASEQRKWNDGGEGWTWTRNCRCKYVSVRVDMRDGAFVLLDAKGQRISLEQLKWQYREENQ